MVVVGPHILEKIRQAHEGREQHIALNNHDIRDEGAIALAEMLKVNRTISKVYLTQCGITDKGFLALIAASCENPVITDIYVSNNAISSAGVDAAAKLLVDSRHKNFMELKTGSDYSAFSLEKMMRDNRDAAKHWALRAQDTTMPLTPDEMRQIESRLSAIRDYSSPGAKHFETKLGLMPPNPKADADFAENLFKPAHSGFAPLDNPRLWQSEGMRDAAQGLKLTSEFLSQKTPKGSTFIASASHGLPAEDFMRLLNGQGVSLGAKELLDDAGKPSALLEELAGKPGGANALFNPKNWLGDRTGAQRVYQALPESLKPTNYHSLLLQCRPNSAIGIGR